jgi:DMSO/TMAO reductase YedYZ molybdopterin-dependent catalytic subunit
MAHSVRGTAGQSEAQARAAIRSDLNLVRKIMRRIQYLLERRTMLDEANVVAQLAVVTALARQLPESPGRRRTTWRRAPPPSMARVAQLAMTMDAQRWLARLIRFTDAVRGSPQR